MHMPVSIKLAAATTALIAGASLGLPAAASAATTPATVVLVCNRYTAGGVTFSVCVGKVNSTTAEAEIGNISGTYVSGRLALYHTPKLVHYGCDGRFYPGQSCNFRVSEGSGDYRSGWNSNGGTLYLKIFAV
jgi:hypothetical protein